ncbi:hypothetical protein GVN18_25260 [Pseudomonas sp. ODNR1LW]|nr:hypothetical protein [Pseudomonas sp. ODNR1LW]
MACRICPPYSVSPPISLVSELSLISRIDERSSAVLHFIEEAQGWG